MANDDTIWHIVGPSDTMIYCDQSSYTTHHHTVVKVYHILDKKGSIPETRVFGIGEIFVSCTNQDFTNYDNQWSKDRNQENLMILW